MPEQPDYAQFEEMSDDVFAELLDNTPAGTAGPSDVIGGAKPASEKKEDAPEPPKENKEPEPKKEKSPEEVEAELQEAGGDPKPEDKKEEKPAEVDADTNASLLKAKALGLIDRGIWREIKDIDDFEWTDENYGELAVAQAQWSAEDMFNEMLDQSGDYGKVIFNHIKNGGDPKEIVDLFREARRVNNLDITEESGQQNIIREYYTKVHKWSDAKIVRFINAAIDNKTLKDEATEIKSLLEDEIKQEVATKEKAQERMQLERQEVERTWANSISSAVDTRQDLTDKEKREIKNTALVYNQPLADGRKVNKFTIDFMKLQADPQKYVELIRFVSDPEKYTKKIEKIKDKEAAKKAWEFVKGSGSVSKGGAAHAKQDNDPQGDFKVDWKLAYKS